LRPLSEQGDTDLYGAAVGDFCNDYWLRLSLVGAVRGQSAGNHSGAGSICSRLTSVKGSKNEPKYENKEGI
jgi:hypothetical protein